MPRSPRLLVGPVALLTTAAWSQPAAACGDVDALVAATERAVVAGRLSAVPDLVTETEAAFACAAGSASRATLGRWYRAQAAWFSLSDAPEEAALAWRSAELASPGAWTDALGPKLRAERDAALAGPRPTGTGTIAIVPPPTGHRTVLDGLEVPFPVSAPPGLHLVQIVDPGPDTAVFARQVFLIDAGELFEIDTGPLAAPGVAEDQPAPPPLASAGDVPTTPTDALAARRSRWPLWAGLGAGALAGTAALLARAQSGHMTEARSVEDLDAAWTRQRIYGWSAYGLAGVAAVGVGVGLAW